MILESFMYLSDGRFTAAESISGRWGVWGDGLFLMMASWRNTAIVALVAE